MAKSSIAERAMMRMVFLAIAALLYVSAVSAQQHNIDAQKSTLTIHVGKTGVFSGLTHEHEVRAPIKAGRQIPARIKASKYM